MKLGEIKIEALKLMFVNYVNDIVWSDIKNLKRNPEFDAYLVNMPGSINRCISRLEEKRVLPLKSVILDNKKGIITGNLIRFDLSVIADYYDISRLACSCKEGYFSEVDYIFEGQTIAVKYSEDRQYILIYYPSVERVDSLTDDNTLLAIPNSIAAFIPYYIKGDLYQEDEPSEAAEAMNWFEQMVNEIKQKTQSYQTKIKSIYSITET